MSRDLFYDLRSWVANQLAYSGARDAWARTDALVEAAREGHVPYEPGLPLVIDGVDCSPENVRSMRRLLDHYRGLVGVEAEE